MRPVLPRRILRPPQPEDLGVVSSCAACCPRPCGRPSGRSCSSTTSVRSTCRPMPTKTSGPIRTSAWRRWPASTRARVGPPRLHRRVAAQRARRDQLDDRGPRHRALRARAIRAARPAGAQPWAAAVVRTAGARRGDGAVLRAHAGRGHPAVAGRWRDGAGARRRGLRSAFAGAHALADALSGHQPARRRFMVWNYVSSRRERIRQAQDDWRARQFDPVPGETEFIPPPGEARALRHVRRRHFA